MLWEMRNPFSVCQCAYVVQQKDMKVKAETVLHKTKNTEPLQG